MDEAQGGGLRVLFFLLGGREPGLGVGGCWCVCVFCGPGAGGGGTLCGGGGNSLVFVLLGGNSLVLEFLCQPRLSHPP